VIADVAANTTVLGVSFVFKKNALLRNPPVAFRRSSPFSKR
jgi:hypothetical protein